MADERMPLYATEAQISKELLGAGHLDEWKAIAQVLERHGLPKIDAQFGRRYFPAVKQFFDRRNGVVVDGAASADDIAVRKWNDDRRRSATLAAERAKPPKKQT